MTKCGSILIGGGTGFIGSHLIHLLKNKGYAVTLISRMPGLQRISWNDLKKNGLPTNTNAVINLAGQNIFDLKHRWSPGFKQNVLNSRVNTATALAQAISESEIKPLVFISVSGVGIYEPSTVKEYDEDSHIYEFDFFSHLCLELEKIASLSNSQTRSVIIRSGVVLGSNGGIIRQLYLPFFCGLGGPIGNGEQYLPWIHITDLTRLILFSIENGNIKGVLNGVAPQVITNKEFSSTFASALRRPALIPVPKIIINLLFNKERGNMLTEGQKVIPKKVKSLGFQYVYPNIESACHEIVSPTQR